MALICIDDTIIQDLQTLIIQIGNDGMETRRTLQKKILELETEIAYLKKIRNLNREY